MTEYRLPRARSIRYRNREFIISNYTEEQVQESTRVLFTLLPSFEAATFALCEILKHTRDASDLRSQWQQTLAYLLLPSFLHDHKQVIDSMPIQLASQEIDTFPFFFFEQLQLALNGEDSVDLVLDAFNAIDRASLYTRINPGWATMLREFGLFGPLGGILKDGIEKKEFTKLHSGKSIHDWNQQFMENITFKTRRSLTLSATDVVYCPARSHVSKHLSLHFFMNASLAFKGLFSPDQKVALLRDGHYLSAEAMCAEYDARIPRLDNFPDGSSRT